MATTQNKTGAARNPWAGVPGGIDPATTLGHVHLTVNDLARELDFYQGVLGLQLQGRAGKTAYLGAGKADLLRLTEAKNAVRVEGPTGLYHFCLLVRERAQLGQLLRSIASHRAPVQGLVDHHTAEAIYLPDPEGNGIELNWDHPRAEWPSPSRMMMLGNAPLDVEGLLAELGPNPGPWSGLPADTRVGHVHLHVGNLETARTFYHGVLGFDEMMSIPRAAGFVAAGGYHHHIAFNVWAGMGTVEIPANSAGLRHFTIKLPSEAALSEVLARVQAAGLATDETSEGLLLRDPAGNSLLLGTSD